MPGFVDPHTVVLAYEPARYKVHHSVRVVWSTAHGEIRTPIFMPVGTAGSVKAVHQRELENDIRAQIILGNTYHLMLRPGPEAMAEIAGMLASGAIHPVVGRTYPLVEAVAALGRKGISVMLVPLSRRRRWLLSPPARRGRARSAPACPFSGRGTLRQRGRNRCRPA